MASLEKKKVRNIFDRISVKAVNVGPSLTQQSLKSETDVNAILKRYSKTGVITHVNETKAAYGDFSNIKGYDDALNYIQDVMDEFMDLPSHIRKEFNNNPEEMVSFLQDPKNKAKAVEMGLAKADHKPFVKPEAGAEGKKEKSEAKKED
jgi:phage internal scaffolding protein